jgi:hypothetical protein
MPEQHSQSEIATAEAQKKLPLPMGSVLRAFRSPLFGIYLPTALCFFVINITNSKILELLLRHHLIYGSDADRAANFDKTIRFFLVPAKSFIFFVCTAVLLAPVGLYLAKQIKTRLKRQQVLKTLLSLCICFILTSTVFPTGFGRSYARISTDPFNQDIGQLYRRLLIPGLANLYHVDGFLYTFLFWTLVLLAALVARLYFLSKDIDLTVLQEVSLLTCGIFASSFEFPGVTEIAVLLLGIVALMAYETDGRFTSTQLLAFSLALMAHEACAIIVFAPMILVLFGRKSWLQCGTVVLIYLGMLLANFSFNIFIPLKLQTTISSTPASEIFMQSPLHVLLGAAFSFKFLWVFLPVGIYYLIKSERRFAWFVLLTFALALGSTYIAIDYSRMVGFGTLAMMVCFAQAREKLPSRVFDSIVALSILVPSFYANPSLGVMTVKGLYYLVYRHVFTLPPPGVGV